MVGRQLALLSLLAGGCLGGPSPPPRAVAYRRRLSGEEELGASVAIELMTAGGSQAYTFTVAANGKLSVPTNVSFTIELLAQAQQPKLAPHIPGMRTKLASVLHIKETAISIKATTTERLGFVGREEGMASQAVALVRT